MNKNLSNKIAVRGLLIAVAFVLSWVEMQIPYSFSIPGIKLGLTNLAVLIALYSLGPIDAFVINILRIFLVSFTFGNMSALMYSLVGGMLSFLVMYLFKRFTKVSMKFVSILGAISHNVGQVIVAILVLENVRIAWYLPYLWISGIVAGVLIGILGEYVAKRIRFN